MTRLTLAVRNTIVLIPGVQDLVATGAVGRSNNWLDGWVFDSKPWATIERYSHKAMVVVADDGTWMSPNSGNTNRFPAIYVDVWASPTRNADGSVNKEDADELIESVMDAIIPVFHTPNVDVPGRSGDPFIAHLGAPGSARFLGSAEDIAERTGVRMLYGEMQGEPAFSDVLDGNGARMGRYRFGLSIA